MIPGLAGHLPNARFSERHFLKEIKWRVTDRASSVLWPLHSRAWVHPSACVKLTHNTSEACGCKQSKFISG